MSNSYIDKLFRISNEIEPAQRKPLKALILVVLIADIWCVIFGVLFLAIGSWLGYLAILNVIIGFGLIHALKTRGNGGMVIGVFSIQLMTFMLVAIYYFGWEFGFHYPLIVTFMFIFLPHYKRLMYPVLLGLANFTTIFVGYYYVQYLNVDVAFRSSEILEVMHFANIAVTGLGIALMSKLFERDTRLSEEKVTLEKKNSEDLLHNILPVKIADRLKSKPLIIADGFEHVSVLFADIAGFTKLSEKISPEELVSKLNIVFTKFDFIAEKYDLEKIKTIGDAYMVSGGLPEYSDDHLEKMACMAIEMIETFKALQEGNNKMSIRIGINAGPVVAGVIGVKKFAYDLWGDTVNTASRMESHGVEDKIHVTQEVQRILCDKFEFEKREPIEVKGKGIMQTYFLIGLKEAAEISEKN